MPQSIHINLDGGDAPMAMYPHGTDPASAIVRLDASEVEVVLLKGGTTSGAHSLAFFARLPDGKLAMLEITAKNFMVATGAVRGRLVRDGILACDVDPGIAIVADPDKRMVHFASEVPLQQWSYTVPEAKKFWRVLKEFAEVAGQ